MPAANVPLWDHFVKDPGVRTAVCNYCGHTLSYRTTITNLKMHLKNKHSSVYQELNTTSAKHVERKSVETEMNLTTETVDTDHHHTSRLWKHFKDNPDSKIAECNYCEKQLSYETSLDNLNQHLRLNCLLKHKSADKHVKSYVDSFKNTKNRSLWEYFDKDPTTKTAECRKCYKSLSYRTSTTNLKMHLKFKHVQLYNELISPPEETDEADASVSDSSEPWDQDPSEDYKLEQEQSETEQSDHKQSAGEDPEESLKLPGVWEFFEDQPGGNFRCAICRTAVGNEYEEVKAHLKDSHPKLLLQIMQMSDRNSDAGSNNADDDNIYTEVVYLEQDPIEDNASKPRRKSKIAAKITPNFAKKRERLNSSCDDVPLKRKKDDKDDEIDELGAFIKYITCLLKKLPQDMFSKVQAEIINTILKANTKPSTSNADDSSPRIILNSDLSKCTVPNLITVNELPPLDTPISGGHNYTITVASKDGESEKS